MPGTEKKTKYIIPIVSHDIIHIYTQNVEKLESNDDRVLMQRNSSWRLCLLGDVHLSPKEWGRRNGHTLRQGWGSLHPPSPPTVLGHYCSLTYTFSDIYMISTYQPPSFLAIIAKTSTIWREEKEEAVRVRGRKLFFGPRITNLWGSSHFGIGPCS